LKDLAEKTIRGGFAKAVAQAASFVIRVGSLMMLARLLDPGEFGLVSMVTAITGVFGLLRDAGLSMATVQRTTISEEQLSTLFWINGALGLILSTLFVALAPALVAFYREPRLFWVTIALGLGFILNAVGVQHSALLQRQMRFTTLASIEMAARGFGHWALVAMALLAPAITSGWAWLASAWIPGLPRGGVGVASMVRFGGTVTLNSLVVYVAYNLDKVLLGRFLGADMLGIYGRAYQLVNIPTENFNSAVGSVAFSALSRLQNDPPRYRSYFLKGYSMAVTATLPVTIACLLYADDIVRVALGPRWAEAGPLLRLLAPTILVYALINPLSWLMLSGNLAGRSLKIALVIAPLVIAAYLAGLPYGARGVASGFSAMMVLLAVPISLWSIRGTVVSARDLLGSAGRPALSGLVATAVCLLAQPGLALVSPPVLRLALGGILLLGVYAVVLLYALGQKGFYLDILRRLGRRSAADAADL
jgi:O-antigen/teichoic acid export membrane protein